MIIIPSIYTIVEPHSPTKAKILESLIQNAINDASICNLLGDIFFGCFCYKAQLSSLAEHTQFEFLKQLVNFEKLSDIEKILSMLLQQEDDLINFKSLNSLSRELTVWPKSETLAFAYYQAAIAYNGDSKNNLNIALKLFTKEPNSAPKDNEKSIETLEAFQQSKTSPQDYALKLDQDLIDKSLEFIQILPKAKQRFFTAIREKPALKNVENIYFRFKN